MKKRIVFIAGAPKGLGKELALLFSSLGDKVYKEYRNTLVMLGF